MTKKNNQEKNDQNDKNVTKQDEKIREMSAVAIQNGNKKIYYMGIIGEIEGHMILPPQSKTTKYEHVIPELVRVEEDDSIDGLLLLLNTMVGDVEAGLAIAEMISSMKKPTVSIVLGGGHSIGVPLAVSSKCSFIVPSATMTIHPVRTNGLVLGVPQTLDFFERMQKRITDFVVKNSNIKESKFSKMMLNTDELATDMGTVLDGNMAVECGLIDKIGSLSDALSELYGMIEKS